MAITFQEDFIPFRTHMLSLHSTTSKLHLVKGMRILLGKEEILVGTNAGYSIIICMRNLFCHNFKEIMHSGFATFILRYQQLHRKLKQNPKQVLNLPSIKKFMNYAPAKQSALEGLRFYCEDIRLNRYKAGKESLVSSCVGIAEAIIACF